MLRSEVLCQSFGNYKWRHKLIYTLKICCEVHNNITKVTFPSCRVFPDDDWDPPDAPVTSPTKFHLPNSQI